MKDFLLLVRVVIRISNTKIFTSSFTRLRIKLQQNTGPHYYSAINCFLAQLIKTLVRDVVVINFLKLTCILGQVVLSIVRAKHCLSSIEDDTFR